MRKLSTVVATAAVAAAALFLASGAVADNVSVNTSPIMLAPGGSTIVSYSIHATGGDCDPAAAPVDVTLSPSDPARISISPSTLSFSACAVDQSVTISAAADAPDGSYTVTPSAPDSYNVDPGVLTINVAAPPPPPPADTTPPALTLPGSQTVEATSAAGAVVTFTVSANDAVDGAVAVSCTPSSGTTFPIGTTAVNCSATDTAGNPAQGSFNVTVQDTTPPVVSVPASMSVDATSAAGAVVTFSASATDAVDGARPTDCSPASGSTFPVGTTSVTCTASDTTAHTGSGSFTVTVTNSAPVVTVPPTQRVEASGPKGANVTFAPAPTAADPAEGPLPVTCAPASGTLFPLGSTTVTCTAVDTNGASGSGSFVVAVVDTTPPVVTAPPDATFVGENGGLSRSNPSLAAYLARGNASDLVDPSPQLFVEAPDFFPYGDTVVEYVAVDASGNRWSDSTRITVVPPPPPGQPRPSAPPPPDPAPGNVTRLRATPGNASLRLTWRAPSDPDVVRYVATRSERNGPSVQVYSGAATSFTDRGLVNGVEYRYVVVAYDRAGNRSVGVAVLATPYLPMLLAPRNVARLTKPTVFTWRRVGNARYYNFQLLRAAGPQQYVKVLSVWPVANRFRLKGKWKFEGRTYQLVPGTYRWYVWPGYGSRADARYGTLLGERSFVVTRRR